MTDTQETDAYGIIRTTEIKFCGCQHAWQDKQHGPGKRVHNQTKDKQWRCTVCGVKRG